MNQLKKILKEYAEEVNQRLETLLPSESDIPGEIHTAMRYSMFAGGKRLRPVLAMLMCDACGEDHSVVLDAACALEMVHTYSLIHDDLPAMDDDDLRRGQPSCHKKFGEDIAILAGDALLTYAVEVIAGAFDDPSLTVSVLLCVTRAIGTQGMIGGQVLDVTLENTEPTLEKVESVHRWKTGALITASVTIGAMAAKASDQIVAAAESYGRNIGHAFQIADDILDIRSTAEELGKTPGKDSAEGKITYPAVLGLEESEKQAQQYVQTALKDISILGDQARILSLLAEYIVERTN